MQVVVRIQGQAVGLRRRPDEDTSTPNHERPVMHTTTALWSEYRVQQLVKHFGGAFGGLFDHVGRFFVVVGLHASWCEMCTQLRAPWLPAWHARLQWGSVQQHGAIYVH